MRAILISFLLLTSLGVQAEVVCENENDPLKPVLDIAEAIKIKSCPNSENLAHLCMAISGRQKDSKGEFEYQYQRIVYEAACVAKTDSESVTYEKIRKMWKTYEAKLICNNTQFDILDGSVLKFAVSSNFDDFLADVTLFWKLDLNKVDPTDNMTVLDYVRVHQKLYKGTGLESKLDGYYDLLKSSGAKHKSEL